MVVLWELNLIRGIRVIFLFTGPPTILVKPQSLQVKAGGIASFYCTAEGTPSPQIHWRKNGKKISRKFALFFVISTFPFLIRALGSLVHASNHFDTNCILWRAMIPWESRIFGVQSRVALKMDEMKILSKLKSLLWPGFSRFALSRTDRCIISSIFSLLCLSLAANAVFVCYSSRSDQFSLAYSKYSCLLIYFCSS